ncbi:MAG: MBOAT family protein [Clostridia bacterium]|nr:MBOAT family protein [Clostridia bacterium]
MVFSSLLFLYAFFPICLIFYMLARTTQQKNGVLLLFSLIFYTWGEPKYVLLLLFMSFADWLFALLIQWSKSKAAKRIFLVLACIVNLGLIAVFKYGMFFLSGLKAVSGFPEVIPAIALPIGISFYTFQLLSYVIDVYRGDVKAQHKYHIVLLYASLFHQCIAGPIVRYRDVENELLCRKVNVTEISDGIIRFTVGLAKKALLANTCGMLADTLLVADGTAVAEAISTISSRSITALWVGVLMYSLQIYLDFSAYSDMAIGMGMMVGLHYKENFDYPYVSRSVTEFWRRWHISLGSFFRDYVYIPLGGNRKGNVRTYFNLFVVWALTGLWHGASWNFVLWGLYFFVFIFIEKLFLRKFCQKVPVLSNIYLLLVVYFGWILFRFDNMSVIGSVLSGMFGLSGNAIIDFETTSTLTSYLFFFAAAILAVTPAAKAIGTKLSDAAHKHKAVMCLYVPLRIIVPIVLLLLSTMALVGNSYNPFLYFQF